MFEHVLKVWERDGFAVEFKHMGTETDIDKHALVSVHVSLRVLTVFHSIPSLVVLSTCLIWH